MALERDRSLHPLRVMHVLGGRMRSGVESVVLDLADGLRRRGGEPILVPLADGLFTEEARSRGFQVEPLQKRFHGDLFSIVRLARLIKRLGIDILHSHAHNGAFYACPAGRLAGLRGQVSTVHIDTQQSTADFFRWRLPCALTARYYIWLMRWCRRVTTVNPALRDDLIRQGQPSEKVVFIPNGIDLDAYRPAAGQREAVRCELGIPAGTRVIGTVARLAPFKNFPMLLKVARQLVDEQEDIRFVIVGDGPDRRDLEKMAAELGIAGYVHFLGWRTDVSRLLSAMDIFVMTSWIEGCSIAALEAMALSKPVVSTRVGIFTELPELSDMGLLCAPGDVGEMVRALRPLVRDEKLARRAGELGRAVAERDFTKDVMTDRMMNVYHDVLAEEAAARTGPCCDRPDSAIMAWSSNRTSPENQIS